MNNEGFSGGKKCSVDVKNVTVSLSTLSHIMAATELLPLSTTIIFALQLSYVFLYWKITAISWNFEALWSVESGDEPLDM